MALNRVFIQFALFRSFLSSLLIFLWSISHIKIIYIPCLANSDGPVSPRLGLADSYCRRMTIPTRSGTQVRRARPTVSSNSSKIEENYTFSFLCLTFFSLSHNFVNALCRARCFAYCIHTTLYCGINTCGARATGVLGCPPQNNFQVLFFAFSVANFRFTFQRCMYELFSFILCTICTFQNFLFLRTLIYVLPGQLGLGSQSALGPTLVAQLK